MTKTPDRMRLETRLERRELTWLAASDRSTKIYILLVAAFLSILAGISRVYVGVHYPTDVIGGWMAGLLWAFVCWLAARQFEGTTHIRAERTKSA
jgi:membrane-associated phospholipid phosphatase